MWNECKVVGAGGRGSCTVAERKRGTRRVRERIWWGRKLGERRASRKRAQNHRPHADWPPRVANADRVLGSRRNNVMMRRIADHLLSPHSHPTFSHNGPLRSPQPLLSEPDSLNCTPFPTATLCSSASHCIAPSSLISLVRGFRSCSALVSLPCYPPSHYLQRARYIASIVTTTLYSLFSTHSYDCNR